MVTLEQIKALVIKSETEWMMEVYDGDKFLPNFIDGMIDEINECSCISDIASFYSRSRDEDFEEGLLIVISIIRRNCVIKE
jgi:hypothetical protein